MSTTPPWIEQLTCEVTESVLALDLLAPFGCHYHFEEDCWEVTIFVSRTEVYGGPRDGRQSSSNFSLDLHSLLSVMDSVTSFRWQALALGDDDDLGSHVSIEGTRAGHNVWLRILAESPADVEPGRIVNAHEGTWYEV